MGGLTNDGGGAQAIHVLRLPGHYLWSAFKALLMEIPPDLDGLTPSQIKA